MWKKVLKTLSIFLLGTIIGILINIPSCYKQQPAIKYVPVHDTITVEKERIVWKTKPVEVYLIDTFYIKESGDTVKLDSVPITEYQYKDTIKTDSTSTEMAIYYSGFNASLDSIWLKHNYFEKETTIVKEPKKVGLVWAIGIGVGFGSNVNINGGTFGYGPQIGIYGIIGFGERIK